MSFLENVTSTLDNIANGIKPVSLAVAGLALVIIGIMYQFAKDPQKKEQQTGWAVNVVIGFALVWLGASLISWLDGKVAK